MLLINGTIVIMSKEIEKIIVKYFSKSASINELEELSRWLDDPRNIEIYREFVKINYLAEFNLIDFDTEKEKQKIFAIIRQKRFETVKIRLIDLYKYAAAILIIVGLGYFLRDIIYKNPVKDIPTAVNTKAEPGTDKATLTIEDGTHIELVKGKDLKIKNADSNGEVIVYNTGRTTSKEIIYNYLTIPRGGQYRLVLSDKTEVWLNSETQLKYPVTFIEGKTREVELVYGEAYFDVAPSSDHQGAEFKVFNQSQIIEVMGTQFNLKAYKDDDHIYTTLVEGKVTLSLNGKKQDLSPDQQTQYNPITNSFLLKTGVNVYNEISWKYGVFSFDGKPLKEIMKIISRWYDVEIFFLEEKAESTQFVGVLRKNRKLEDILINIKNFGVINDYEINEKRVILK